MRARSAHTDRVTRPKRRINPTVRQALIRPTASGDHQTRRPNDKWTTELHQPLFIGLALAIVLLALGIIVATRFTGSAGVVGIAVAVIAGLFHPLGGLPYGHLRRDRQDHPQGRQHRRLGTVALNADESAERSTRHERADARYAAV